MGFGVPVWLAIAVAVIAVMLIGFGIEEAVHWPLNRKRAPSSEVHLIASLGAYLVLVQCIALIWGNETRILRAGVDSTWSMGSITLAQAQTLGPVLALLATLALFVWLSIANRGIELRALADNPILVALLGRNILSRAAGCSG